MRNKLLIGLMVLPLLAGCATPWVSSKKEPEGSVSSQIADLKSRMDESERSLDDMREQLGRLEQASPVPGQEKSTASAGKTSKRIQIALRNAGYYQGAIDGKIGTMSRKAIKEFQSDNGLKVDGIVGSKTWAALRKYLD